MVARSLVADAFFSKPDYVTAAQAYQQALELAESLSREDAQSLQKRTDVYVLIAKLADIDERCERFDQAAQRIEQLRESLRDSARAGLITVAAADSLDAHHAVEKSAFQNSREAIDRPATIETQSPRIARRLWGVRSLALARRGKIFEATEAAETLRRLAPGDVDALGVVARTYALCLKSESSAGGSGARAVEGSRSLHGQKAVDALRGRALAAGIREGRMPGTGLERAACVS